MLNQGYLGEYNFLFVVLDSCRYDSYRDAKTPNGDRCCKPRLVYAPSYFTWASHMAFFRGFTPSSPGLDGYYNIRKFVMFRLSGAAKLSPTREVGLIFDRGYDLASAFAAKGYHVLGTGGVQWFKPTPTSECMLKGFRENGDYYFDERLTCVWNAESIKHQLDWLERTVSRDGRKNFVFINSGLTHHPYEFGKRQGYGDQDRRAQIASVERFDAALPRLLTLIPKPLFVIITADHGDLFGEDGMWMHPMYHPLLHKVPMMVFEVK